MSTSTQALIGSYERGDIAGLLRLFDDCEVKANRANENFDSAAEIVYRETAMACARRVFELTGLSATEAVNAKAQSPAGRPAD